MKTYCKLLINYLFEFVALQLFPFLITNRSKYPCGDMFAK